MEAELAAYRREVMAERILQSSAGTVLYGVQIKRGLYKEGVCAKKGPIGQ